MQFTYTEPQTELERLVGGHHHICIFGTIEPGDDQRFSDFLMSSSPPPRIPLYINSTGGDVEAAIGIGKLVRERWHETTIGKLLLQPGANSELFVEREFVPGRCLSAATLIFLGGILRDYPEGSEFGVHQFSFRTPSPDDLENSQKLSAKIARYLADLDIDPRFLELSATTSGDELELIEETRLRELGVITGGITDVEWTTNARANMIYVKGERHIIFGHQKVMLGFMKNVGFQFWAVIESQGREEELTTFGLIEIMINGEEVAIDISDRCVREIFGNYTNVLASLSLEEARAIAFSESFGVQIKLTHEAGMFLGIDAMPTEGGKEQLTSLFNVFEGTPSTALGKKDFC